MARRATFVLITSLTDLDAHPARWLLEPYRNQHAVESRFRMIKDPLFVNAIFLHTPRRIEALSYVRVMACLVYSLFEGRVRQTLARRGERIEIPGKRFTAAPTARSLLLMLEGLCVARLDDGPWQLAAPPDLRIYLNQLLRLVGHDLSIYYGTRLGRLATIGKKTELPSALTCARPVTGTGAAVGWRSALHL